MKVRFLKIFFVILKKFLLKHVSHSWSIQGIASPQSSAPGRRCRRGGPTAVSSGLRGATIRFQSAPAAAERPRGPRAG